MIVFAVLALGQWKAGAAEQPHSISASEGDGSHLTVVVLPFDVSTSDPEPGLVASALNILTSYELHEFRNVYVLDTFVFVTALGNNTWGSRLNNAGTVELAKKEGIAYVLRARCETNRDGWTVEIETLKLSGETSVLTNSLNASDWHKLPGALSRQLSRTLGLEVAGTNAQVVERWGSISSNGIESLARFGKLRAVGGSFENQARCLQDLAQTDPSLPGVLADLGSLYEAEGQVSQAEQVIRKSLQIDSNFEPSLVTASRISADEGNYFEALRRARSASQLNPYDPDPLEVEATLEHWLGYNAAATNTLSRIIELVPVGDYNAEAKAHLDAAAQRLSSPPASNITAPAFYDAGALTKVLSSKLSADQLKLVTNPVAITDGIKQWAAGITRFAQDDESKVRLLFAEFSKRAGDGKLESRGSMRTAQQVLDVWSRPDVTLYCRDYAMLFVAAARCAGIKAYDVDVLEDAFGSTAAHDCAAVYIGDRLVLVDPAQAWYGAPHKRFVVLNDVQAIAIYLVQLPGIEYAEVGYALAPDLELVQLCYFETMIGANRLAEARAVLPSLLNSGAPMDLRNYVQGLLALQEGDIETATKLLLSAASASPDTVTYQWALAKAYAQGGDVLAAQNAFNRALKSEMTVDEDKAIRTLAGDTNEIAAWGSFGRGVAMLNSSNWPVAEMKFSQVIALRPGVVNAYIGRAIARKALGDTNGSNEDIARARGLRGGVHP